jgi:hypothetical protein
MRFKVNSIQIVNAQTAILNGTSTSNSAGVNMSFPVHVGAEDVYSGKYRAGLEYEQIIRPVEEAQPVKQAGVDALPMDAPAEEEAVPAPEEGAKSSK